MIFKQKKEFIGQFCIEAFGLMLAGDLTNFRRWKNGEMKLFRALVSGAFACINSITLGGKHFTLYLVTLQQPRDIFRLHKVFKRKMLRKKCHKRGILKYLGYVLITFACEIEYF